MVISIEEEILYSRQLLVSQIDKIGQQKIKAASVLLLGCGGLGSVVSYYLAGLGVGHLGLVDYDKVELSNLPRQIIYDVKDINAFKSSATQKKLTKFNPFIKISNYQILPDILTLKKLVKRFDCVVDCLDNTASKLLANKVCWQLKTPLVHAGIRGWNGQTAIFRYRTKDACLNCLIDQTPQSENDCSAAGVLGPICGLIGSMQALSVLKYILNMPQSSDLKLVDGQDMHITSIGLKKNMHCNTCR